MVKSARFAKLTKEPVPITVRRGETINGLLVYGHGPSRARGTVVLEGYPYTVMPVGDVFLDRGFNVFICHRPFASGKIGFGHFEKYDLEVESAPGRGTTISIPCGGARAGAPITVRAGLRPVA